MNIRMLNDEGVFRGTPKQIVEAMQYVAIGPENSTLGEDIEWLVDHVERLESTS